jgi:hypothetical protein
MSGLFSFKKSTDPFQFKPKETMKTDRKINIKINGKQKPKYCYISGKISGMVEEAERLFQAAEAEVVALGYTPVNPIKLNHDHDLSWSSYMRVDIKALCGCDAIYLLGNWGESPGARIEADLAHHLEMDVHHQHRFLGENKSARFQAFREFYDKHGRSILTEAQDTKEAARR